MSTKWRDSSDSETQMGEVRTKRILSRPRWGDRQRRGTMRLDDGLSAAQDKRGEEEWQESTERNKLDSLHSPLPPEPGRCVLYREDKEYCATEKTQMGDKNRERQKKGVNLKSMEDLKCLNKNKSNKEIK